MLYYSETPPKYLHGLNSYFSEGVGTVTVVVESQLCTGIGAPGYQRRSQPEQMPSGEFHGNRHPTEHRRRHRQKKRSHQGRHCDQLRPITDASHMLPRRLQG